MSETIKISSIDDTDRLRPVSTDHVELIAASIEERGLEQPIVVRSVDGGYRLTIGANRLAAMKALGWTELKVGEHVLIRDESELEARISEIDENLARYELNALDRALFMAERKKLYEERRRVQTKGGDRKSNKLKDEIKSQSLTIDFSPRFTLEAAKRVGMSETAIKLALRIAERLDPEAIASIRGTMVERNQQELLALADLEPKQQREAATRIGSGEAKTVRAARIAGGLETEPADDPQGRLLAEIKARLAKCDFDTLKIIAAEVKRESARKFKAGVQS